MLNNNIESKGTIGTREISLSTGKMAKQANGSVILTCGKTVLLATATMTKEARENIDFLPLIIEFSEKMYSGGKIPGGFFKREARPSTEATLTARLIDRPIRPCFSKEFHNEIQVVVTLLSYDETFSFDPLAIIASSAALSVSDIPFNGPIGAARVGLIDGNYIANPSNEEMENSTIDIIVAGSKEAILMVEAGAKEVSEEEILESIAVAHEAIKESITVQENLAKQSAKPKITIKENKMPAELEEKIRNKIGSSIEDKLKGNKSDIETLFQTLEKELIEEFSDPEKENEAQIKLIFSTVKKEQIRNTIIKQKIRPDGRALDEIRPIETEIGLLPNTHGSSLFTRGETQSLGVITLGSTDDEQLEDNIRYHHRKNYYFHYNFPPFSVGEVGFFRTGRRELGHGALAERALQPVIPDQMLFPYTIRIVSEILESNGSSSMASVCSGTLALMDCGVPIKAPVSGIAMGLLLDQDDYSILSDIQGLEDHYGDMDFKVAGTKDGITALQLDIKVSGLSAEILTKALAQAKKGRLEILNKMIETIEKPRELLSETAPKIEMIPVPPDKIGVIIGPGGKMIKHIQEVTGCQLSVLDDPEGKVSILGTSYDTINKAKGMVQILVKDVEEGDVYEGKVVKITNFGAFIEVCPGKEGLLHISKISDKRIEKVEDVLSVGQIITVKVIQTDGGGKFSLKLINETE